MQGDLILRACSIDDLSDILKIERESFPSPWSREDFLAELRFGALSIVAELDGKVVGYLFARVVHDTMDINNICVSREFRGRGIGRRLLRECLDIAQKKEVRTVFLEVRRSNRPAINLYRSFGFSYVATRRGYYSDGEDALVLALKLN